MVDQYNGYYKGKNVLITGGLGFIGSNLAIRLVDLGSSVMIVDNKLETSGGNEFNIEPIKHDVHVNYLNICDKTSLRQLVRNKHIVFHLAAQMSHTLGLKDQKPDIENNIIGTVTLLECCKEENNGVKLVYTGSRGQYGEALRLPVDEDHPRNPIGSHEISKNDAEDYARFYHRRLGLDVVLTRLSNVYGPRSQIKSPEFGVANWFVGLALRYEPIPLMGDSCEGYGIKKRDFLYVDDCVDALLLLASKKEAIGHVYNIGNDEPSNFRAVAEIISDYTRASIKHVTWSKERKLLEPGDFYPDISKIRNLGWSPRVPLEEGIRRTVEFLKLNKDHYW